MSRGNCTRELQLKNSKISCPCLDDVYLGLPCRHQIAIFSQKKCVFRQLFFNKRWNLLENAVLNPDPLDLEENSIQEKVFFSFLFLIS